MILVSVLIIISVTFFIINDRPRIPVETAYNDCLDKNKTPADKGACLQKLSVYAVRKYTPQEIESAILIITDNPKLQWCHEFMHYAGWELYRQKKTLFASFSSASGKCDSGMYHGIVEEYIKQKQASYDPEGFVSFVIPRACEDEIAKNDLVAGMKSHCFHGLGHAFMFISDNDLNASLRYCDRVKEGQTQACQTGAFMENIQTKQIGFAGHPSKFRYDPKNPDFPCSTLDEKYKDLCYIYKGISNVVETKGDFKKSFQMCFDVDPKFRDQCFWGVGNDIPGPHWSSRTAGEKCLTALEISPHIYEKCIEGAMVFLIQINFGDSQAAVDFCDVIKPGYKDLCYRSAGQSFKSWLASGETIADKCKLLPDKKAQTACLGR